MRLKPMVSRSRGSVVRLKVKNHAAEADGYPESRLSVVRQKLKNHTAEADGIPVAVFGGVRFKLKNHTAEADGIPVAALVVRLKLKNHTAEADWVCQPALRWVESTPISTKEMRTQFYRRLKNLNPSGVR